MSLLTILRLAVLEGGSQVVSSRRVTLLGSAIVLWCALLALVGGLLMGILIDPWIVSSALAAVAALGGVPYTSTKSKEVQTPKVQDEPVSPPSS